MIQSIFETSDLVPKVPQAQAGILLMKCMALLFFYKEVLEKEIFVPYYPVSRLEKIEA